jgi:hypothetical protein
MTRLPVILLIALGLLLTACGQTPAPKVSSLDITITGLPAGLAANVNITGPDGYDKTVTASGSLGNLVAGTYTITPSTVTDAGTTYTAAASSVTVPETKTTTINYQASPGELQITITGQAPGAAADVLVTGPDGYSTVVTATTTLEDLVPGEYQLLARRSGTHSDARISDSSTTVQVVSDVTAMSVIAYRAQTVLLYSDGDYSSDLVLPLLNSSAFAVTRVMDNDRDTADEGLLSGTHDLVIWLVVASSFYQPAETSLTAHLEAGGRFLYFDWDQNEPIAALLNSEFTGTTNNLEISEADASLSADVTLPLMLSNPGSWGVYTTDLTPLSGGSSLCTFAATSDSCAVLGNDGRSLHLGFPLDAVTTSPTDGQQFWANAIELLLSN